MARIYLRIIMLRPIGWTQIVPGYVISQPLLLELDVKCHEVKERCEEEFIRTEEKTSVVLEESDCTPGYVIMWWQMLFMWLCHGETTMFRRWTTKSIFVPCVLTVLSCRPYTLGHVVKNIFMWTSEWVWETGHDIKNFLWSQRLMLLYN